MTDSIALTINSVSNFLAKKQFVYMFFVTISHIKIYKLDSFLKNICKLQVNIM